MQRQFDVQPARAGSGSRRRQTIGFGIGPEHVFDLAFEHDLCRHGTPVRLELALRDAGQLT